MDQKTHDGAKQNILDFKCKKKTDFTEKSGVVETKTLEPKISCQTPEKINEPLHNKLKEGLVKLPEKYRILAELFDHMSCSLRLLSLYKRLPTFGNISTEIGVLAQRKFSHMHLAQMKYMLPEALQIDKIVIHDKRTLCMKPDMKITLLFELVEGHSEVSDFIALCQVFSSRLYNFFTTHPEASDVPEAVLPEPFTQRRQVTVPHEFPADCYEESQLTFTQTEFSSEKFNPGSHFSRHFSQKAVVAETEKTQALASVDVPPINTVDKKDNKSEQQKEFVDSISVSNFVVSQDTENEVQNNSPGTCSKSIWKNPQLQSNSLQCSRGSIIESPTCKLTSSNDSSTIETQTPLQLVPKRSVSSCVISQKMMTSQRSTPFCKPAKRALDFYHSEGDDESTLDSGADESKCEVVRKHTFQIPKGFSKDGNIHGSSSPLREVEEGFGSLSEVCNESQRGEHQHVSSCLVDMVSLICSIFKSVNCYPITKEELVHKIIMNSFDIVDKKEVEDHIDLLEQLVPDWIYRKLAPSGDIMYNIRDISDLDSIRAKLTSV